MFKDNFRKISHDESMHPNCQTWAVIRNGGCIQKMVNGCDCLENIINSRA